MSMNVVMVDENKCAKCGTCIRMMQGYCISEQDGFPVIDYSLCNICQKCVSICPSQAIMVNNTYPEKITEIVKVNPDEFVAQFKVRRSIKHFKDKPVHREILQQIVSIAKYAPNQNKNISIMVIDRPEMIVEIDRHAFSLVHMWYKMMFGFKPITWLINLFYKEIHVIKRKMEYDVFHRKHVVKKNTQALIILTGNKKIAVTKPSAHYMMAAMMNMAETLSIGNSLMDSLLLTLNIRKSLRKKLNITDDVLGVLCLGYSDERVVNIPRGYEVETRWIS